MYKLEKKLGLNFAYYFILLLFSINKLLFLQFFISNDISRKILYYYYLYSYKIFFLKLKISKAYNYKFKLLKHYLDSNHCNGNNEICNYLNIFLDCKLYTECPHFISDSSTLRYKNIDFFKDCFFKKKNLGRVIYIGPNYTINDSIYNFDTLIVNKIPPFEIKSFRFVVLILNNGWTLKNNTLISEWEKNNDNSIIISPLKINDRILPHKVFDFMPQFPFQSSLMGLQRSLFILYQLYNYQTMNVCGFDFNLTTKSYMKWYPSLMKEHFGSFDRGVVLSSCVHDLLLNFLFAKRIASHDQRICGDILHYLKLTPEDVVCRFQHVRAF